MVAGAYSAGSGFSMAAKLLADLDGAGLYKIDGSRKEGDAEAVNGEWGSNGARGEGGCSLQIPGLAYFPRLEGCCSEIVGEKCAGVRPNAF